MMIDGKSVYERLSEMTEEERSRFFFLELTDFEEMRARMDEYVAEETACEFMGEREVSEADVMSLFGKLTGKDLLRVVGEALGNVSAKVREDFRTDFTDRCDEALADLLLEKLREQEDGDG